MEGTQTIQQMCATFGVTARTLRFYESKELLSPTREGTRRLFTPRDNARLKLILRGKRLGFSLEEIRQLLDMYDIVDGQATQLQETYRIACARLEQMENQRDELNDAINELQAQLDWGRQLLQQKRCSID
jgi:DNA-binding transcriptional MerR regulator